MKYNMIKTIMVAFVMGILFIGCNKTEVYKQPEITEISINPNATSVLIKAKVNFLGEKYMTLKIGEKTDFSDANEYQMIPDGDYDFYVKVEGLKERTSYYFRIEVGNVNFSIDSEMLSFVTDRAVPIGAVNGLFSIGSNKKVWFSCGNLQFCALSKIWRFAENQWDYVGGYDAIDHQTFGTVSGSSNDAPSSTYSGWIDLFGWGTSGYNNVMNDPYAVNYQPWSASFLPLDDPTYNRYGYGPSSNMPSIDLTGSSANYDWGVFNAISNGGNQKGIWRVLTAEEWSYLIDKRTTVSSMRYAKAIVNGVNGLVLFPDDWDISIFEINDPNNNDAQFNSNIISSTEWINELNPFGAVFLPAAGHRDTDFYGTQLEVALLNYSGEYWSSTHDFEGYYIENCAACCLHFSSDVKIDARSRCYGISVRLVCDDEI